MTTRLLCRWIALVLALVLWVVAAPAQRSDLDIQVKTARSKHPIVRGRVIGPNKLRVQVRDELQQQITGLQAESFVVHRKGLRAEVINCVPVEDSKDLSQRVVLLIDNSGSMSGNVDKVLTDLDTLITTFGRNTAVAVVLFTHEASRIIEYHDQPLPVLVRWFSTNRGQVVRRLHAELSGANLIPNTHLYDEIWAGYRMLDASRASRRNDVAIVLSDGEDNSSRVELEDLLKLDWGSTSLYAIDYMSSATMGNLQRIAQAAKGKYFSTNDITGLKKIFTSIQQTLVLGGYDLDFRVKEPARASQARFSVPLELLDSPSANAGIDTLVVEDQVVRQRFPLLGYLFFEPGSAAIPSRYALLANKAETDAFEENRVPGNALDHYYNILNIIGYRMRINPTAEILITGCSDGDVADAAVPGIGRKRAEAVRDYLQTVWGIDPQRLLPNGRVHPEIASTNTLEEGKAENRRVEIASLNLNILAPVAFEAHEVTARPAETVFKMEVSAANGLRSWRLPLYAGPVLFHELHGTTAGFVDQQWNWKNAANQLPRSTLRYEVIVEDSLDVKTTVAGASIPVRYLTTEQKQIEHLPEMDVERISLILFEFGKSDMGAANERILRDIPDHVEQRSSVRVLGYTDVIGEEEGNRTLSDRRARVVADKLRLLVRSGQSIGAAGLGETSPLFDNGMPEGRFYNRTVQIVIETPRTNE
jgi:outer membrane protein OmpA-like peptidoglycan-associated protein/Mg-chelatase subunit ChlD